MATLSLSRKRKLQEEACRDEVRRGPNRSLGESFSRAGRREGRRPVVDDRGAVPRRRAVQSVGECLAATAFVVRDVAGLMGLMGLPALGAVLCGAQCAWTMPIGRLSLSFLAPTRRDPTRRVCRRRWRPGCCCRPARRRVPGRRWSSPSSAPRSTPRGTEAVVRPGEAGRAPSPGSLGGLARAVASRAGARRSDPARFGGLRDGLGRAGRKMAE